MCFASSPNNNASREKLFDCFLDCINDFIDFHKLKIIKAAIETWTEMLNSVCY
jgi:hypothetical protein